MNGSIMKILFAVIFFDGLLYLTNGHGMLLNPPARGSRWRYNNSAPVNFDDSGIFCGGFSTQYDKNGGKCGLCGDNYADPRPRANELGGKFGQGDIVEKYEYKMSGTIEVGAMITANHAGYYYFYLCDYSKYGENEECFLKNRINFVDGTDRYYLPSAATGWYNVTIKLPAGLSCEHCILQWTYNAGNSWGVCEDGTGAMGCGAQENFRTCSDISIVV